MAATTRSRGAKPTAKSTTKPRATAKTPATKKPKATTATKAARSKGKVTKPVKTAPKTDNKAAVQEEEPDPQTIEARLYHLELREGIVRTFIRWLLIRSI